MKRVALLQDPAPTLIGERVNAQGSRKIKQLLLADDYAGIVQVARQQVESGAHLLDVCVAVTERSDEAEQMRILVKKLAQSIEAPLVIDATDAKVFEAALKVYPGRAVLNSINMENGLERIETVCPIAEEHGTALIALTISKEDGGMAKTADLKFRIAEKMANIVTKRWRIETHDLIFDALTFTLATGDAEFRNSAAETIEGIRRIKAGIPGALTSLGVSNVSFGLGKPARAVLNSVFLHHCVQAGLDTAIVNPAEIKPYAEISSEERALADDMVFNRRDDALPRFIAHFEQQKTVVGGGPSKEDEELAKLDAAGKIHWRILHRKPDGVEALINEVLFVESAVSADTPRSSAETADSTTAQQFAAEFLAQKQISAQNAFAAVKSRFARQPVDVLNNVLLPAMKEVGDKFGAGELILPFVLQSAEAMKRCVAHLEQFLEKQEGSTKGKVVLATVFGDVHDIGKNLVKTILSNNGYTVFDLGKQVPVSTIINKAVEVKADAIGLSALLVSTSKQMPICVQELQKQGLRIPVLIGGAAINRNFGFKAGFVDEARTQLYPGGVFYSKDAFEGLNWCDKLVNPAAHADTITGQHQAARESLDMIQRLEQQRAATAVGPHVLRSKVKLGVEPPAPPFWGWRVVPYVNPREIFPLVDKKTLFLLQWGASKEKDKERLIKEKFEPLLRQLEDEFLASNYLTPKAIYGYFPCASEGESLIVYDPHEATEGVPLADLTEVARFSFPRQQPGAAQGKNLCLADYFAPTPAFARQLGVKSSRCDVLPLQLATVGPRGTEICDALDAKNDYTQSYFVHGLYVETAEGVASWMNDRIKRELRLDAKRGLRYSFGYPALPDLAEQEKIFALMPVKDELGVELTTGYQLNPEASTAAIILHHPEATYFVI
jgi:5-methyltetrahydrofolate--homocysteine methyltransferase